MHFSDPQQRYQHTQRQAVQILLVLVLVLLVFRLLSVPSLQGLANYLPFHMLMETVAVAIASMIFVLGWHARQDFRTYRTTILACAFLGVALLDFTHMLSFQGMPNMVGPADPEKAINFWLMARLFAAVGLLITAYLPIQKIPHHTRWLILSATLVSLIFLHWLLLFQAHLLPATFNADTGLTPFKITCEYVLILLYSTAAFKFWMTARRTQHMGLLTLAVAAATMVLSELFFTFYSDVTDVYNLLGHVYKLIAYGFLYRALIIATIDTPFQEIADLNTRITATLNAMPDMVFEVGADTTIHDYHSQASRAELIAPPEQFIGRKISEFLPEDAVTTFHLVLTDINSSGRSSGRQYSLITASGPHRYEISGSLLSTSATQDRYILVVRDVSARYLSETRVAKLMGLANAGITMDEKVLAQQALDTLEEMTLSKIGFLHLVSEDQAEIEMLAWSSATLASYCHANYDSHYPVATAGIWADCIRQGRPIIINDYDATTNKKGLPEGHSELKRLISVPILEGDKIVMLVGLGNAEYSYGDDAVKTVQLFGNELFQIIQRRRAQRSSDRSQRIMKAALDHLPIGVAVNTVGKDVHFEYMNDNFPRFYQSTREALSQQADFWEAVYEDQEQRQLIQTQVLADFTSGDPARMKWEAIPITRTGQVTRYITAQNIPVPEEGLAVSLVEDITERLLTETELRIAATAFSSQEGIMITDAEQRILRVNPAFEVATGYKQEEIIGKSPRLLSSGRHDKAFYAEMWRTIEESGYWHGEMWNQRKNGEPFPQSLSITAVRNSEGEITHYVADFIDISDIKTAEEAISKLSYYDSLTGLVNRERLRTLLAAAVEHHTDHHQFGGLLMLDLDNFKTINETMGHTAGDELLVDISQRLQRDLHHSDIVSRYGGDEFVVLLNNIGADPDTASAALQRTAQSLLTRLEGTYSIGKGAYYNSCSIGATLFGPDADDLQELLKQLDIALFAAKANGRNRINFFDPALQMAVSERTQLLSDLRSAIDKHEFELYYQAQLDQNNHTVGAEALVRWNHPQQGVLSPGLFIPMAEQNGLMLRLGEDILQMGIQQLRRWQDEPSSRHLKLSINITADQFYEKNFEAHLRKLLEDYAIDVNGLMLEFTESMLLHDIDSAAATISRLNEVGLQFAIDDFGTGYSSLAYLSRLPMNQLKIDQSFIHNIGSNEKDMAIIRTIIDMAHTLDMEVLAEGVEKHSQRKYLLQHGCKRFQGFLFSKPLPLQAFNALLLDSQTTTH
jgi:diguanylate cyclase (GGDEF)-like protein/PAS domain S-box-containing protein